MQEEMLPRVLRRFISDVSERMQVPPDYIAVSIIIIISSLLGRKVRVFPKKPDDWSVIPNLWGVCIGRPSLMKSPAILSVLSLLEKIQADAFDKFSEEMEAYKFEEKRLVQKKKIIEENIKQVLKNKKLAQLEQENEINNLKNQFIKLEDQYIKPVLARLYINDATIEKLEEILLENPNGILMYRDELMGLLRSFDKQGHENDRSFFLESWNGKNNYIFDRIGRGTIRIPSICISLPGSIQPGPFTQYVNQSIKGSSQDDGFLQRLQLSVWPDAQLEWKDIDRPADIEAQKQVTQILESCSDYPLDPLDPLHLRFTNEAQEVFDIRRNKLEQSLRSDELPQYLEAHFAKYRSLFPSIAAIIEFIDCIDKGRGDPNAISLESANYAKVWCEYLKSHAHRIYSTVDKANLLSARALFQQIKNGDIQNGFTKRSVYHGNHWCYLSSSNEVEEAISVLKEHHILNEKVVKSKGRPTNIFYINLKIYESDDF